MNITEIAKAKVVELIDKSQDAIKDYRLFLRITATLDENNVVKQQTYFDYETRSDDRLLRFQGFDLRIDEESYKYLKHATLGYDDSEDGNGFFLDNPDSHSHSGQNVI